MTYPISHDDFFCCEGCRFYATIDSGGGWCRKNPPKHFTFKFKLFGIQIVVKQDSSYPVVPFNMMPCDSYILKKALEKKRKAMFSEKEN